MGVGVVVIDAVSDAVVLYDDESDTVGVTDAVPDGDTL